MLQIPHKLNGRLRLVSNPDPVPPLSACREELSTITL